MLLIFTVYDTKAETFMPPFFVPAIGLATRTFSDCINSNEHHFAKHPADYTLFKLGSFDTDTCHFDLKDKISLGNGVEFLLPDEQPDLFEATNGSPNPPILPDKIS